jgi:hypothetical protein
MPITTKTVGEADPANVTTETAAQALLADLAPTDDNAIKGRLIMDYGDSGDGKSTRAHSLARYYYAKTGLKVRLVSAEDSSKLVFQDLIDAGIVEAVFITEPKTPLPTYERLVEGEWPLQGQFDEVKVKVAGVEQIKKRQKWQRRSEWEGSVSAYIIEGLSTISENILDYLRETGRFPREQSDGFSEDGRTFMAASQTAFGFAQSEGIKLLKASGQLPVDRVLWTAHEAKGKDEFDGGAVRGPKLVGTAATNLVRKLVGVLLHADRVDGQVRVYYDNHADKLNKAINWSAKTTVAPTAARDFKTKYPLGYLIPELPKDGYVGSNDGLIPFLKFEEEIRTKSSDAASQLVAIHNKESIK